LCSAGTQSLRLAVARGTARCALHVLDRGAQAVARGGTRSVSQNYVTITAAKCSPAVTSRRAKYVGDYRALTPLVHSHSTQNFFPMALSEEAQLFQRGGLNAVTTQIPEFYF
jgi:hypothetical protein